MAHLTINFRSKALGMPVMLDVLMPQGRGGYKTLYLLHGAGGHHTISLLNTMIPDYVNNRNIAVVMPSGKNRFYVNNEYGKNFYTYITEELVNQCEQWFDISRKAEDRYIAGMSMGGYGAVYAGLKKPSMYNTVFSYSGLLNILERYDKPQGIDMFPVFGTRQQLIDNNYDLYTLINQAENVQTKYVIACGTQDPRIHMSRQLSEALTNGGIPNVYRESPGAHDFAYWDYCIEQTVKYICGEESLWQ